ERGKHAFGIWRRKRREVLHSANLRIFDHHATFIHKTNRWDGRPVSGLIVFKYGKSDLLSFPMAGKIDKRVLLQKFLISFRNLRTSENNKCLRLTKFKSLCDFQRNPDIPDIGADEHNIRLKQTLNRFF